uniref:TSA: Wollemia nobilis Ref_Wollemi_Transcript_12886_3158 transcribed RNA sequence n=1 Tax=Wollemia nobilis TaxID=56998 RepID=A0A0C9RL26_9CONI
MAHQLYNPSQSLGAAGRGNSALGYGTSRTYDSPMFSRENGGGAFDPAAFSSRESRYFPVDPLSHPMQSENPGGLAISGERYMYGDRMASDRPPVEGAGRLGSLGMDRYVPSEVTQRPDSSRYFPGQSLLMNGSDAGLYRAGEAFGSAGSYLPGRHSASLVSPPLQQTTPWPGVDNRGPTGVTGVKRPHEEVSNQQTSGIYNTFGQSEAFLSTNALSKRHRMDNSLDLPIYPQRPGEKDCTHYMVTRTCKFGAKCKFDHPTWVPAGGIPDWKEVSSSGPPPERPGEPECPHYMKTGMCKYGAKCKFDHPKERLETLKSTEQVDGSEVKPVGSTDELLPERPGEPKCDYFIKTGKCKFGANCKFDHPKDGSVKTSDQKSDGDATVTGAKVEPSIPEAANGKTEKQANPLKPAAYYNTKGLPIRPGETECPFYVKTGSCKYGTNCRFSHPERMINPPSTVMPFIAPNQTMIAYPGMLPQPALGVNIPPQRAGQPDCSHYMKTGECKFGPTCKFNHPVNRLETPAKLTPAGLPRREGEAVCTYYVKTGICKFGTNCKFDHPPPAELEAAQAQPTVKLTLAGFPRREGESTCPYYMKTGTCKYGATCKFDHPPPGEAVAKAVAKASTNDNVTDDEKELNTDPEIAEVKDTKEDNQENGDQ